VYGVSYSIGIEKLREDGKTMKQVEVKSKAKAEFD